MVALVGDYILIISVGWSSWIMENGGQREREREIEGIEKRETSDFLFSFLLLRKFLILWYKFIFL